MSSRTSSRTVNAYLSDILPGLTAKVFRTHHATMAVHHSLESSGVGAEDPEYRKWETASLANLEAAVLCNHTKKEPATWERSRKRYREREQKAQARIGPYKDKVAGYRQALADLRQDAADKIEAASEKQRDKVAARYEKRIAVAERRVSQAETQLEKARQRLGKIQAQAAIATQKRTWNLGTSLKSYIDPRVYYEWGQQVDYDVLESYYPKALRSKFGWVKRGDGDTDE